MSQEKMTGGCYPPIPLSILSDRVLVHRILLTDPERFHTLTVSGKPRMLQTPSYTEFCTSLDNHDNIISSNNNNNNTLPTSSDTTSTSVVAAVVDLNVLVNGTFRHEVCQRINHSQSLEPVHDLLLELHDMLRSLVPSRRDLHKLLVNDAIVRQTDSMTGILLLIIQAAQALQALESEARAISTNEWIQSATSKVHHHEADEKEENGIEFTTINPQAVSYLVTSIMYLLFKAELCHIDKQDFYLSHVWAREILQKGLELERINFETEFGSLLSDSSSSTAPATRSWIRMLLEKETKNQQQQQQDFVQERQLSQFAEKQRYCNNLVRVGWVDSILFHSPPPSPPVGVDGGAEKSHLLLPEIFALDQDSIQAIRTITKLAAAGSALALHACQVACQPVTVLNNQDELSSSSPIHLRRTTLVHAMSQQWKPQKVYEQDVTTAVLALAKEWKSSPLDQESIDVLSRRTTSVLQGQDPVLQLLDGRMKECFRQVVLMIPELIATLSIPTKLQTGRRGTMMTGTTIQHADLLYTTLSGQNATASASSNALDVTITKKACDLFCSRGLSFYALELSTAAKMASRIVELALQIYGGNILLDKIIVYESSSR